MAGGGLAVLISDFCGGAFASDIANLDFLGVALEDWTGAERFNERKLIEEGWFVVKGTSGQLSRFDVHDKAELSGCECVLAKNIRFVVLEIPDCNLRLDYKKDHCSDINQHEEDVDNEQHFLESPVAFFGLLLRKTTNLGLHTQVFFHSETIH